MLFTNVHSWKHIDTRYTCSNTTSINAPKCNKCMKKLGTKSPSFTSCAFCTNNHRSLQHQRRWKFSDRRAGKKISRPNCDLWRIATIAQNQGHLPNDANEEIIIMLNIASQNHSNVLIAQHIIKTKQTLTSMTPAIPRRLTTLSIHECFIISFLNQSASLHELNLFTSSTSSH